MTNLQGDVRYEFATAPLNQQLAYMKDPTGRYMLIEAKNVPSSFAEIVLSQTNHDDAVITATTIGSMSAFLGGTGALGDFDCIDPAIRGGQRRLNRTLEDVFSSEVIFAEFGVTYWESLSPEYLGDTAVPHLSQQFNNDPHLQQVRSDLQNWFCASIDDLAMLLDLSPTTIVNLSKPGRSVRAKTIRKMLAVHGAVRELQRALGPVAALAWVRTMGRQLLSNRKLFEFEQFVSTHIFPSPQAGSRGSAYFGRDDIELEVKAQRPIGKASRL